RQPGLEERLFKLADLRLDRMSRAATPNLAAERVDELAQDQLRVANDGMMDRIVLVDVARIDRHLDEVFPSRHPGGEPTFREAAADAKNQVGLDEKIGGGARDCMSAGSQR